MKRPPSKRGPTESEGGIGENASDQSMSIVPGPERSSWRPSLSSVWVIAEGLQFSNRAISVRRPIPRFPRPKPRRCSICMSEEKTACATSRSSMARIRETTPGSSSSMWSSVRGSLPLPALATACFRALSNSRMLPPHLWWSRASRNPGVGGWSLHRTRTKPKISSSRSVKGGIRIVCRRILSSRSCRNFPPLTASSRSLLVAKMRRTDALTGSPSPAVRWISLLSRTANRKPWNVAVHSPGLKVADEGTIPSS